MKFLSILLLCLTLGACASTGNASNCAGWKKLNPNRSTQAYIVNNDENFAVEVLSHNQFGASRSCWK